MEQASIRETPSGSAPDSPNMSMTHNPWRRRKRWRAVKLLPWGTMSTPSERLWKETTLVHQTWEKWSSLIESLSKSYRENFSGECLEKRVLHNLHLFSFVVLFSYVASPRLLCPKRTMAANEWTWGSSGFELFPSNKSDDLEIVCVLQVDAGGAGCIDPDGHVQLQCFVLLLLCHRLLWTLVADIPSQRPGLSQNTGRTHIDVTNYMFTFYSGSIG